MSSIHGRLLPGSVVNCQIVNLTLLQGRLHGLAQYFPHGRLVRPQVAGGNRVDGRSATLPSQAQSNELCAVWLVRM